MMTLFCCCKSSLNSFSCDSPHFGIRSSRFLASLSSNVSLEAVVGATAWHVNMIGSVEHLRSCTSSPRGDSVLTARLPRSKPSISTRTLQRCVTEKQQPGRVACML